MASPAQRKRKRNTDASEQASPANTKKHKRDESPSAPSRSTPPEDDTNDTAPNPDAEEEYWEAVAILREKGSGRNKQYLIQWAGTDPSSGETYSPTWEWASYANKPLKDEWAQRKTILKRSKQQKGKPADPAPAPAPIKLKLRRVPSTPPSVNSRESQGATTPRGESAESEDIHRRSDSVRRPSEETKSSSASAAQSIQRPLVEITRRNSLQREDYELLPNQTQFIASQITQDTQPESSVAESQAHSETDNSQTPSISQEQPGQQHPASSENSSAEQSRDVSESESEARSEEVKQRVKIVPDTQSAADSSSFLPSFEAQSGERSTPSHSENQSETQEHSTIEEVSAWRETPSDRGQVTNTTEDSQSRAGGDRSPARPSDFQQSPGEESSGSIQDSPDKSEDTPVLRNPTGSAIGLSRIPEENDKRLDSPQSADTEENNILDTVSSPRERAAEAYPGEFDTTKGSYSAIVIGSSPSVDSEASSNQSSTGEGNSGESRASAPNLVSSVAVQPSASSKGSSVTQPESLDRSRNQRSGASADHSGDSSIGRKDFAIGESNNQSNNEAAVNTKPPKLFLETAIFPQTPPANSKRDFPQTPASAASDTIHQSVEETPRSQTFDIHHSPQARTAADSQISQSDREGPVDSTDIESRKLYHPRVLKELDIVRARQNQPSKSNISPTVKAHLFARPLISFSKNSAGSNSLRQKLRKTPPRLLSNASFGSGASSPRSMAEQSDYSAQEKLGSTREDRDAILEQIRQKVSYKSNNMPSPSEIPAQGPQYPIQPQSSLRNVTMPTAESDDAEMQSLARTSTLESASLFREEIELDVAEYIVPIVLEKTQKDMHTDIIHTNRGLIDKLTNLDSCAVDDAILDEAEAFLRKLRLVSFHMDLLNPEALDQDSLPPEDQYKYDNTVSAKLRFLGTAVDILQSSTFHIVIVTQEKQVEKMIEKYLRGRGVSIVELSEDGAARGTTELRFSLMAGDGVRQIDVPVDAVIAFDPVRSVDALRDCIVDNLEGLVPVFTLVVPYSIDHIELCVSPLVQDRFERNKLLLNCVAQLRPKRDRRLRNNFPRPTEAADYVATAILGMRETEEIDWSIPPLPTIKDDVEYEDSLHSVERTQFEITSSMPQGTEDPANNKRHLDAPMEIEDAEERHKRQRTDVENANVTHVTESDESGAQESQPAAELRQASLLQPEEEKKLLETIAALKISEADAQAQSKDYRGALEGLQFRFEEHTSTIRGQLQKIAELELYLAHLKKQLAAKDEKVDGLREELNRAHAEKQEARELLENNSNPNLALLGNLQAERDRAVAALAKLEGSVETDRKMHEYTREQYQIASNKVVELSSAVHELEEKVRKLEPEAAGERVKLRKMFMSNYTTDLETENSRLKQDLRDARETLQRNLEEIRILKERNGRQGVGTRASSVPRSPHVKPSSRAASPLPGSGSGLSRVGVLRGA